ncbi:hypothetical protein N7462_000405 [Penicillium macrosclerotiorum]|uniref:uncharacterized protein n=1 Tax=Penicillium macrosclerotiorum TaxID=303699 RepID=UPI002548A09F|nr:uncharacterized protein N7462_000405 [Penicillium macrosclerotiorum]KAJ5698400.1 hypothetical protein N7462_000405 [Penicillium macrosclerotiorum]
MRFLNSILLAVYLGASFVFALSEQATRFYKQLSVLEEKLDKNRKAIDQYNGGILATGPLGTSAYELWSAFRIGNVQLREATANGTVCPPEERADVMEAIYKFGFDGVQTMRVYKKKQSVLRDSRMGFITPIFLDAILREIEEAESYSRSVLGNEYDDQISRSYGLFKKEWTSVFDAFTANLQPDLGFAQDYKGFMSTMQPILGILF